MRVWAILLLFAVPVFGQRFDDTITVNVVDVPVYVERSGVPVRGLTREDFALFVDGKPHPIEYFDVIDEKREAGGTAEVRPELKRRRLIVLLFDLDASPHALQRARDNAMKYVDGPAADDSFAVATIGKWGVRFVAAFTTDRIAVKRAIGTLSPSASRDPFRVATLDAERSTWAQAVSGGSEAGRGLFSDVWGDQLAPGAIGISSAAANAGEFERIMQELEAAEVEQNNTGFIEHLTALADRLAALEGVKHVVLLSERRVEVDDTARVVEAMTRATRSRQRMAPLHQRYREAGVILNGVDIRPLEVPAGGGVSTAPWGRTSNPSALASGFLYELALETGGAVASSLPHLLERNSVAYVIGFQAKPGVTRGAIRVEVQNLPLLADVRYRKSFDVVAEKSGDKGLFLADTILNDIPQNGVTLDLAVKGTEVTASIPGGELLSYASGKPLGLEVFFYVFNDQGRPFSWNLLQVAVDLEKGRDFLSTRPYRLRQDLVLQPGRYVVKALVRIAGTDRVGFARAGLVVP